MFNSCAITKIQSVILICAIVIAAVGGVAYFLLTGQEQSSETIKIGVFTSLSPAGRNIWQGAVLAADQLNLEGGILGREVEVINEGVDLSAGVEAAEVMLAFTRVITIHEVDFIIGSSFGFGFSIQDMIAEHEVIFLELSIPDDGLTQRVLDDYDSCKNFFRVGFNATSTFQGITDSLEFLREQTGFNKVGYLSEKLGWTLEIIDGLDDVLPELGFDLVHKGTFPPDTVDF